MLKWQNNGKLKIDTATTRALTRSNRLNKYNIYYQNYLIDLSVVGKIRKNEDDRLQWRWNHRVRGKLAPMLGVEVKAISLTPSPNNP